GEVIRLRDAYNVKLTEKGDFALGAEFTGKTKKDSDIIPWLLGGRDIEVVMGNGEKRYGIIEAVEVKQGERLNLDRLGYVRVDAVDDKFVHCYFTHR
ncbi:MAG: hypothetical protein ABH854_02660, partial [Candidatus Diapherotrites archaeon]